MPENKLSDETVFRGTDSRSAVIQELIIHPDGSVEFPWISPAASQLILTVCQEINYEPFPVKVVSGQLYCG